jgi:hypothetical protein
MAKIYLETSFISACVWNRTDTRSLFCQDESCRWWQLQRKYHELCVSAEVLRELSQPGFHNKDDALLLTLGIAKLPINDDVKGFAKILVRERVMPGPEEEGDAMHVATATVHAAEFVISWNVKHLANLNKVKHLREVCRRVGYVAPTIVTPDMLWT